MINLLLCGQHPITVTGIVYLAAIFIQLIGGLVIKLFLGLQIQFLVLHNLNIPHTILDH